MRTENPMKRLLGDPRILEASWRRVRNWYRGGDFSPKFELASWEFDSTARIADLGDALETDEYAPAPFPLVPYPKRGAILRHYCRPSVRDQVAFTAIGLLLAPLVETRMSRCSFANRWYRGLYRGHSVDLEDQPQAVHDRNLDKVDLDQLLQHTDREKWMDRDFALSDSAIYQPYRRGHGLFRRASHWAATAMLARAPDPPLGRGDKVVSVDDYPETSLPPYVSKDRWVRDGTADDKRGYWAQLDFRLAYPSVRIQTLHTRLREMLADSESDPFWPSHALRGYPLQARLFLDTEQNRFELADHLAHLLAQISYTEDGYEGIGSLWIPKGDNRLPLNLPGIDETGNPGLPTGLTISGLLMNVYLNPVDRAMEDWFAAEDGKVQGAYLRFADDIVVMCPEPERLLEGLDRLWASACGDERARFAQPGKHNPANLRIHPEKIEPDAVAKLLHTYQKAAPAEGNAHSISNWFAGDFDKKQQLQAAWHRSALRGENLGSFVTYLVERMSTIGADRVGDRFEPGQTQRLADLHELVRLDIHDRQVRPDTRLAFAVIQLARAWLPEHDPELERRQIRNLRASVRHAVLLAPWKFKLWRAAIRLAVRRPHAEDEKPQVDHDEAREWLENMFDCIRRDGSWTEEWPESEVDGGEPADGAWKPHYLSLLRAEVWRAIGDTLHDLNRVIEHHESKRASPWQSGDWTFRAVPETKAIEILDWLSDFDHWTRRLYDEQCPSQLPKIEREALMFACLARWNRGDMAEEITDWQSHKAYEGDPPDEFVPWLTPVTLLPETLATAQQAHWMLLPYARRQRSANRAIGKHLWAAAKGQKGARAAVARAMKWLSATPPIGATRYWQRHLVMPKLLGGGGPHAHFRRCQDYHLLRRFGFPQASPCGDEDRDVTTLEDLLSTCPSDDTSATSKKLAPSEPPVLGLPTRIACRMLLDILEQFPPASELDTPSAARIHWILARENADILVKCRQRQFQATEGMLSQEPRYFDGPLVKESPDVTGSALHPLVLALADGAAALVPSWRRAARIGINLAYFLVALEGDERWLDQLFDRGPSSVPFEEYWGKRNRIHLPQELWEALDELLRPLLTTWSPSEDVEPVFGGLETLRHALKRVVDGGVGPADFDIERVDIRMVSNKPQELCRRVLPMADEIMEPQPKTLTLKPDAMADDLCVRIAQVRMSVDWPALIAHDLRPSRDERQRIMAEIASLLGSHQSNASAYHSGRPGRDAEMLVFPEATLPLSERRDFERLVSASGKAALIGMLWRKLPQARPAWEPSKSGGWLVNEASLHIPVGSASSLPLYRTFTIRKPLPNHVELALARTLSSQRQAHWRILPGRCWYRFVHDQWGDFSVAICSDLLDPTPWAMLRGQLMHLFQCTFNKDIDLFRSLTWVRAYETFVNVVSTNHGVYGGSFVWTPKGKHQKTIAKLEGSRLSIAADVLLPVKRLYGQQLQGCEQAVEAATAAVWTEKQANGPKTNPFKSPPPGYKRSG